MAVSVMMDMLSLNVPWLVLLLVCVIGVGIWMWHQYRIACRVMHRTMDRKSKQQKPDQDNPGVDQDIPWVM